MAKNNRSNDMLFKKFLKTSQNTAMVKYLMDIIALPPVQALGENIADLRVHAINLDNFNPKEEAKITRQLIVAMQTVRTRVQALLKQKKKAAKSNTASDSEASTSTTTDGTTTDKGKSEDIADDISTSMTDMYDVLAKLQPIPVAPAILQQVQKALNGESETAADSLVQLNSLSNKVIASTEAVLSDVKKTVTGSTLPAPKRKQQKRKRSDSISEEERCVKSKPADSSSSASNELEAIGLKQAAMLKSLSNDDDKDSVVVNEKKCLLPTKGKTAGEKKLKQKKKQQQPVVPVVTAEDSSDDEATDIRKHVADISDGEKSEVETDDSDCK